MTKFWPRQIVHHHPLLSTASLPMNDPSIHATRHVLETLPDHARQGVQTKHQMPTQRPATRMTTARGSRAAITAAGGAGYLPHAAGRDPDLAYTSPSSAPSAADCTVLNASPIA